MSDAERLAQVLTAHALDVPPGHAKCLYDAASLIRAQAKELDTLRNPVGAPHE